MPVSFETIIEKAFEKVEKSLRENNFEQARFWYGKACNLYSQHPTGNSFIEMRKEDLYRTLFER